MRAARSFRAVIALVTALGLAIPAQAAASQHGTTSPRDAGTHLATTGSLLRNDTGLYPRVIRLQHSGSANGQVIASVVGFDGGGNGAIYRSTDDGATFSQIGAVRDQAAPGGLCCTSLYELPKQIGAMPAGTLLWSASIGQDAPNRRMTISLWKSLDHGVTWSFLSTCQNAPNTGGLWEPELEVDTAGDLVCHYSDETDPGAHSQQLVERFSSDGMNWGPVFPTVAPPAQGLRPGMAVVRRMGAGQYYMTYEICGTGDQFDCAVHYRTSADGANWGPPTDQGPMIRTATGQYFAHAPTVAWLDNGTSAGRLLVVGQQFKRGQRRDRHDERAHRAGQHRGRRRQLVPDQRPGRRGQPAEQLLPELQLTAAAVHRRHAACWRSPPRTTGRSASLTTQRVPRRARRTRPASASSAGAATG